MFFSNGNQLLLLTIQQQMIVFFLIFDISKSIFEGVVLRVIKFV